MIDQRVVNAAAPNLMNICIDCTQKDELAGRFYNRYSTQPVLFEDVNNLLIQMDRLMDRIDFPQASTRNRGFSDRKKNTFSAGGIPGKLSKAQRGIDRRRRAGTDRRDTQVKTTEEILKETGKRATFLVNVQYRQNATWQGKVLWAETGESCHFRSALELLKLMDGALDEGTQEDTGKRGKWDDE